MKSAGADGHVEHTLGQTPLNQEELWPQGTQGNETGPTEWGRMDFSGGSRLGAQGGPSGRKLSPRTRERARRKLKDVVNPGKGVQADYLIPPKPPHSQDWPGPQEMLCKSHCHPTPPSPHTLGTLP